MWTWMDNSVRIGYLAMTTSQRGYFLCEKSSITIGITPLFLRQSSQLIKKHSKRISPLNPILVQRPRESYQWDHRLISHSSTSGIPMHREVDLKRLSHNFTRYPSYLWFSCSFPCEFSNKWDGQEKSPLFQTPYCYMGNNQWHCWSRQH